MLTRIAEGRYLDLDQVASAQRQPEGVLLILKAGAEIWVPAEDADVLFAALDDLIWPEERYTITPQERTDYLHDGIVG